MKIELSTYEAANILLEDEFANWSHNAALAYFEERTNVITFDGGLLIQQF